MSFNIFFEKHKDIISKLWLNSFWERFGEASAYFKKEVDQFTNPFAYHIEECFKGIVEALGEEFSWEKIDPYLDKLAQIRAVQERVFSVAAMFFLDLKKIIREQFGEKIISDFGVESFLEFEDKINSLLIRFIDFYQRYRERLYEIKLEEWKRSHYLLLKRAGLITELEEQNLVDYKKH
ncbi:MAG: RsbRD N-terminal domain-containing protein [Caldimicrobium sp.]